MDPSFRGKLVVRFTIGTTGRVTDAAVDENELGNEEVGSCVRAKIRAWTTPFRPDTEANVSYPFVFGPAEP